MMCVYTIYSKEVNSKKFCVYIIYKKMMKALLLKYLSIYISIVKKEESVLRWNLGESLRAKPSS